MVLSTSGASNVSRASIRHEFRKNVELKRNGPNSNFDISALMSTRSTSTVDAYTYNSTCEVIYKNAALFVAAASFAICLN